MQFEEVELLKICIYIGSLFNIKGSSSVNEITRQLAIGWGQSKTRCPLEREEVVGAEIEVLTGHCL